MNIKKTIGALMMCAISVTPLMAQQTSAESYQPSTYQEMEQLTVNEQVTTVITASEPIRFVDISTDKIAGDQPINNTVRLKPKEGLHEDGEVLDKAKARAKRHQRVRNKINGTADCPRLNVFRSSKHIYAQVIDDVNGVTLCSASSMSKDFEGNGGNKEGARKVGEMIAQAAKAKGIENVVFDRGGYLYHGRVQELADGAREGGLKF